MMNVPKYIIDNDSYIVLTNQETINHSKVLQENQHFIFKNKDDVYLYLNNYQAELNLIIEENANIKIYLIINNSRRIDFKLNVSIHEKGLLKLYTNFKSTRETQLFIKRDFNLARNSSLIMMNQISYHGDIQLDDNVYLNGELANLDIDLLNVGSNQDQSFINQNVYHRAKKTYSQIHNWLISQDNAKLNYKVNGKIEKGNEKSSCQQINKGIILAEKGEIRVVPTLYIDEYDVEASHGAAIGQIDENQLFYLLSRGLNELEAKNLIISGYINPFISRIKNKTIESQIRRVIQRKI